MKTMSSDSDELLVPNNVFSFQGNTTVVSAKGPNVNTTFNFRGRQHPSSTLNMPHNFERRYAGSMCDQRSFYRRETSPMSLHSASGIGPRNFNYPSRSYSQRSMINGRGGSPMSIRSIDSTVSKAAIVMAFENGNFDVHDVRMIEELCKQFHKQRDKRAGKHRNPRYACRGRSKSGYDSGELGSDSSISSDDCTSIRSCRSAMTASKVNYSSCRSTKSEFIKNMQNSKFQDNTQNPKQNGHMNVFSVRPTNPKTSNLQSANNEDIFKKPKNSQRLHNNSALTQGDRFKYGFVLPSQRFNSSLASLPEKVNNNGHQNSVAQQRKAVNPNADSGQEDMIPANLNNAANHLNVSKKRKCDTDSDDNTSMSSNKRRKLTSPKKKATKSGNATVKSNKPKASANKSKDFVFIVPQFPVRKTIAPKVQEKLISKSAQPLTDVIKPTSPMPQKNYEATKQLDCNANADKEETVDPLQQTNNDTTSKSDDVSMRPSFIKRKLFTQKLDVTENKNTSIDNIQLNSPQTSIYSDIAKEKNKARKLVTSQLCLSRDVTKDNNNLLDLIHKIVPANQMNLTNIANKTDNQNCKENDNDKWDVTSVISNCNRDDASDTYTDEEIFNVNENKVKKTVNITATKANTKKQSPSRKEPQNVKCNVVLEKLTAQLKGNETNITNCAKSFWDTDFESDIETVATPKKLLPKIVTNENFNNNLSRFTKNQTSSISENNKNVKEVSLKLTQEIKEQIKPKESVHIPASKKGNNNSGKNNEKSVKAKHLISENNNKARKLSKIILDNGDSSLNTTDEKLNNSLRSRRAANVKIIKGQTETVLKAPEIHVTKKSKLSKPKVPYQKSDAKNNNNAIKSDKLNSKEVAKNSPKMNTSENSDKAMRSLRSRDIDLSTTLNSDKTSNKENVDTSNNKKYIKAKSIKKIDTEKRGPFKMRGKEMATTGDSDVSFLLSNISNTTITNGKRVRRPPAKFLETYGESDLSDLSFTLNSPVTRKRAQQLGNGINNSVMSKTQKVIPNLSITRSAKKTPVTKICSIKNKRISANSKKR